MVPWKKIAGYLKKRVLSPDQDVLDWIDESPENRKLFDEISDIWELTRDLPTPFAPVKSKAWETISSKINKNRGGDLGFALHAVFGYLKPVNMVEVVAPMGQKSCIILPDGSNVTLNGGTSLKYPDRFRNKEVNMELSGEAFFEVTNNSSREFIVNASALLINVTGTEFNVKSYIDDSEIEIALKEGSIELIKGQKNMATLKPNEAASYDRLNGDLNIEIKDIDIITAWKNDELVFDNTPFSEVAKYLERYYGVNVELDPALGNSHNFTFKIKTESLREILRLINHLTPINYTIDGKNLEIKAKN